MGKGEEKGGKGKGTPRHELDCLQFSESQDHL